MSVAAACECGVRRPAARWRIWRGSGPNASADRRALRALLVRARSGTVVPATLALTLLLACGRGGSPFASTLAAPIVPTDPAHDIAYLASPLLSGRGAGTAGGDSAANFIARGHALTGLRGAFELACDSSPCERTYFQFFSAPGVSGHNVAAIVPGTDPALANEFVVVGAHFDHLGMSPVNSLDPQLGEWIRPGADDNASGTAALLELGRRLAAHPTPRSVLLVHFDAEELGMVGSSVFVHQPPVPASAMVLMVNLDMVGRLHRGSLIIDVTAADRALRHVADSVAQAVGVPSRASRSISDRSDHASFRAIGVTAVALFTGFHADYHRVTDVASRVDVPGLLRVVDVAEGIVRAAASPAWPSSRRARR